MEKLRFKPGFTTCPVCSITGTPQDPYMAVPTADDRVYCHACQNVCAPLTHFREKGIASTLRDLLPKIQELPAPVFEVVLALLTTKVGEDGSTPATYVVTSVERPHAFSDPMTEYDYRRASAAVASDMVDTALELASRVSIGLTSGPYAFSSVRLNYEPKDLESLGPQRTDCLDRAQPLLDRLTGPEGTAVAKLAALGFELGHVDIESSIRHVHMHRGPGAKGIAADLSWYV
jgi:hypothetical protein